MKQLEQALKLKYPPFAIFYAQEVPEGVKMPNFVCSMMLIAQVAKGKTVAMSKDSCRCPGAGVGFGLTKMDIEDFPGGAECYFRFLSSGNADWEHGRNIIAQLQAEKSPSIPVEEFIEGEGFYKTPELAREWLENLPENKPEGPYIIMKPLRDLAENETPKVVSFLVNPDQLSALIVLANYDRKGVDAVRIPHGAGCNNFGQYAFEEADREAPRAIVGLNDISARYYLGKPLGRDIVSFTVPFAMYEEMESNAGESFLSRHTWKAMMAENKS